jgi:hypothetical protein
VSQFELAIEEDQSTMLLVWAYLIMQFAQRTRKPTAAVQIHLKVVNCQQKGQPDDCIVLAGNPIALPEP